MENINIESQILKDTLNGLIDYRNKSVEEYMSQEALLFLTV